MNDTQPTLPGFRTVACEIAVPAWALTAHPNEIRAMAAQSYPDVYCQGILGSIAWDDLIRFADARLSKETDNTQS